MKEGGGKGDSWRNQKWREGFDGNGRITHKGGAKMTKVVLLGICGERKREGKDSCVEVKQEVEKTPEWGGKFKSPKGPGKLGIRSQSEGDLLSGNQTKTNRA